MFTFNCGKEECISKLYQMIKGEFTGNVILSGEKPTELPASEKLRITLSSDYSVRMANLSTELDELHSVSKTSFEVSESINTRLFLMRSKCIEEFIKNDELPLGIEDSFNGSYIIVVGICAKDVGTMKSSAEQITLATKKECKVIVYDEGDPNYTYLDNAVVESSVYLKDKTFILIGNTSVEYGGDTLLEYTLLE